MKLIDIEGSISRMINLNDAVFIKVRIENIISYTLE